MILSLQIVDSFLSDNVGVLFYCPIPDFLGDAEGKLGSVKLKNSVFMEIVNPEKTINRFLYEILIKTEIWCSVENGDMHSHLLASGTVRQLLNFI